MHILFLIMSGLVFVMWAFSVLRTFLAIRDRACARTNPQKPRLQHILHEARVWLRDPAYRQARRQLLMMTLAVIFLGYLFSLSGPAPS